METPLLSLSALRRAYPACGLILILACLCTIGLWYAALFWYEHGAYPFLLNTSYVRESMIAQVHSFVLFGVPLVSLWIGWMGASWLSGRVPNASAKDRRVLLLLSMPPLFVTGWLFLAMLLFFFPDRLGVFVQYHTYQIAFIQQYTDDPFRATALSLEITRGDGERLHQQLSERWEPRDGTTRICQEIAVYRQDEKLYFRCDDERITSKTSYIDLEKGTVYVGWAQCGGELVIAELFETRKFVICGD